MPPEFTLPKSARLLRRGEYLALNAGRQEKIRLNGFLVVCRLNGLASSRLGVTATKKIGPAVVRNRFKRAAREFFRLRRAQWPQGFDLLFIALRNPDVSRGDVRPQLGPDDDSRLSRFLSKAARAQRNSASEPSPSALPPAREPAAGAQRPAGSPGGRP